MKAKYMQGSSNDECVLDPKTWANGDLPYSSYVSGTLDATKSGGDSLTINTRGIGFFVIKIRGNNYAYNAVYLIQNSFNQGASRVDTQIGETVSFYAGAVTVTKSGTGDTTTITVSGSRDALGTELAFYRLSD